MRGIGLVAGLLLAAGLAGCGGAPGARLTATPAEALLDVPVQVRLTHVDGDEVTVRARATDREGTEWTSAARLPVHDGAASLDDASVGGSYRGRDPMGLFETMRPSTGSAAYFLSPDDGYDVRLTAQVAGATVAKATVHRRSAREVGVASRALTVGRDGVHGRLYAPPPGTPTHPGVLLFGGSEGGEQLDFPASLLAAQGYPTLSLAYFAAPGLPPRLERIPLEYFARALGLLARAPGVDPARLVVDGGSRGSEAAFLLATYLPRRVYAVVAGSPTDHANGAGGGVTPAWTWRGHGVPTAPPADFSVADPADAAGSVFDVSRVRGPILTICGGQDLLWPSCDAAAAIAAARREAGRADGDRYLSYPDAGHSVDGAVGYASVTTEPVASDGSAEGGTLQDDLAASGDAHQAVLAFLAGL